MKPSQPMQVISRRLTSPRAPSTPPQSEHAPDKVDGKTPGSLSSREESAGTPTAREERTPSHIEGARSRRARPQDLLIIPSSHPSLTRQFTLMFASLFVLDLSQGRG
ncbi:hypothetical protein D5086_029957 [Populus alba]|uniref:Uncharacterized protein n=1 Tax=Populus alba TaxID=43335 RepID=A0ACC4AMY2_POPAL